MSLSQLTATGSLAATKPKLKMDQSANNTLNASYFTMMCWAYHTGGTSDVYQDILSLRDSTVGGLPDDDQVIGLGTHVPGAVRVINIGDVDTDVDGVDAIPDNQWFHYTFVGEPVDESGGSSLVRLTAYIDAVERVRSSDSEMRRPTFPGSDCWIQLFNSRSSETDGGGVFVGYMSALKIWNNVALTPMEIWREMWSFMPVRQQNLFSVNPLTTVQSAAFDLVNNLGWTVQGTNFATGVLEPPGVMWGINWPSIYSFPIKLTGPFPTYQPGAL